MKQVLVISSSLRSGSNSEELAKAFSKGASEAGNQVEQISLKNKELHFCKGCYGCVNNNHRCVVADDAPEIIEKMKKADVIAFATPVYFYEMAGQLKTLLDRTVSIYDTADCRFKDIYLLLSAGENDPSIAKRIEAGVKGWIECFPNARLAATVFAGGFQEAESVDTEALAKAQKAGSRL